MRPPHSIRAALLASCLLAVPVQAQIVRSTVGSLTAVEGKVPRGADTATVALFGAPFLGPTGYIAGVQPVGQQGFQYLSLNFTVSATTLPHPRGPSYDAPGNLRRLHAHVTLTPLDANQQPLTNVPMTVLATFPDTILLRPTPVDSGTTHLATAAFNALTRQFLPQIEASRRLGQRAGAELVTFMHLYHRPSAEIQVGYMSAPREVGWIWYGKEPSVIDGTHHTSAALEVGGGTRFVRVRLQISAEWRSHGHWMRDAEYVLALPPA